MFKSPFGDGSHRFPVYILKPHPPILGPPFPPSALPCAVSFSEFASPTGSNESQTSTSSIRRVRISTIQSSVGLDSILLSHTTVTTTTAAFQTFNLPCPARPRCLVPPLQLPSNLTPSSRCRNFFLPLKHTSGKPANLHLTRPHYERQILGSSFSILPSAFAWEGP